MPRHRKTFNPFFLLLGVVGAVFAVSAFVYGVMALRLTRAAGSWAEGEAGHPLMLFFRENGTAVLTAELVVLALLTVAAIWTDDYWARRAQRRGA
jgi:hypothetical protein